MLHLQIDPRSGLPAYRQVVDQVKYYVASGVLAPGAQLPSIRELAKILAVNPTTVVKAYDDLAQDGVIVMQHGKGAFVAEGAPPKLGQREREATLRRLLRPAAVEARQLGVSADQAAKLLRDAINELEQNHG